MAAATSTSMISKMTSRSDPHGADTFHDGPPSGSAKGVLVELFRSLDEEEQEFLRNVATETRELLAAGKLKEAWRKCTDKLDTDEQLALWSLFGSSERTALNKGKL